MSFFLAQNFWHRFLCQFFRVKFFGTKNLAQLTPNFLKPMGLIPHTRKLLNITQQDLSEYLLVKRSRLNMAERDERYLPNEKFMQVMELNQYLEIPKPLEELAEVKAYRQTEQQNLQVYIQERMALLKHQQRQLQEKLEKQRIFYEKLLRAYHAFTQANANLDDKPEHQQGWLRLHYTLTKEKLEKNGQRAMMMLEIKLVNIMGELEVLKQYND